MTRHSCVLFSTTVPKIRRKGGGGDKKFMLSFLKTSSVYLSDVKLEKKIFGGKHVCEGEGTLEDLCN